MPERFKVVLDHARRYTSARLYLYLYLLLGKARLPTVDSWYLLTAELANWADRRQEVPAIAGSGLRAPIIAS